MQMQPDKKAGEETSSTGRGVGSVEQGSRGERGRWRDKEGKTDSQTDTVGRGDGRRPRDKERGEGHARGVECGWRQTYLVYCDVCSSEYVLLRTAYTKEKGTYLHLLSAKSLGDGEGEGEKEAERGERGRKGREGKERKTGRGRYVPRIEAWGWAQRYVPADTVAY